MLKPLISALLLAVPGVALATNGYFTHGLGVKNKSMAGAGTADPQEAMAIATNPASAVLLGNSTQLGLALFSPRREYEASSSLANGNGGAFTLAPGTVESGSNYFPIPYAARTWQYGDDSALGLSVYGRGGMNTDYSRGAAIFDPDGPGPASVQTLPGVFGTGDSGVNLNQLFAEAAYARRNGRLSWGISGIFAAQAFEAKGVAAFAPYTRTFAESAGTVMPMNLSNNGHEYATGFGGKIGAHWQATDRLMVGISYQSRIYMSEFDDYSDLFAAEGGFDVPPNVRLGVSYRLNDLVTLHYDTDHTNYRDVDSVGNPISNLFVCPSSGFGGTDTGSCLGGDRGAGFGWNDVTVHKFGIAWKTMASSPWTFRAGVSHGQNPVEPQEVLFNVLAPGVIERHFTFGSSYRMRNGKEFSLMLMYAPEEEVRGRNAFDPTQSIELRMHQYEIEFGLSW